MKVLFALVMCLGAFTYSAQAQQGEFKFGAGAHFFFDGASFGVQGKGNYGINDEWAGQASFSYFFEDFTFWTLDLDAHYGGLELGDVEGFALKPFAGLQIANVSVAGFGNTEIGINLGLNATLPLDGGLSVYIEPKLVISGASGLALAGGVYF